VRCRSGIATQVLLLALGAVPPVCAQDPDPTLEATPAAKGRTMARLPVNMGRSLVGFFSEDNVVPLMAGSTAAAIGAAFDTSVKNVIADPENSFGKSFETAGGATASTIAVASLFVAGRFAHGARFRAMTYDMLTGSVVNLAYTQLLKVAVGRERPDGSNDASFPSGHSSQAFVLATVAERHYGWKVGVPSYAAASLMAFSRLQRNKHYLSDVIAGSTLGYIVGRTTVRTSGGRIRPRPHEVALSLAPLMTGHERGLQARLRF
jgi:membrane-associated phospholipid phosphatase